MNYISFIILDLNNALIELTGVLAGFPLAFNNSLLIAMKALITCIPTALSMSASEYLFTKSEIDITVKLLFKDSIYK